MTPSTDATRLLEAQHKEVKKLFGEYEKTEAAREKEALFVQIADKLAAHCTIEEKIFYPSVYVGDLEDELEEATEEHLSAKRVIADLLEMSPDDRQFDAKMTVLKELIEHHVEEEEEEVFPQVRKDFANEELQALGEEMSSLFEQLMTTEPRNNIPSETDQAAPLT